MNADYGVYRIYVIPQKIKVNLGYAWLFGLLYKF